MFHRLLRGAIAGVKAVGIPEDFIDALGDTLFARGTSGAGSPWRPSAAFHWFDDPFLLRLFGFEPVTIV
jgi:hypothetical protein